jgi:hypothetical protein
LVLGDALLNVVTSEGLYGLSVGGNSIFPGIASVIGLLNEALPKIENPEA